MTSKLFSDVNLGRALASLAGELFLQENQQKQIKARAFVERLKETPYITFVDVVRSDNGVTGAIVDTGALIRSRRIIEALKKDGWEVEDLWPTTTTVNIKFNL